MNTPNAKRFKINPKTIVDSTYSAFVESFPGNVSLGPQLNSINEAILVDQIKQFEAHQPAIPKVTFDWDDIEVNKTASGAIVVLKKTIDNIPLETIVTHNQNMTRVDNPSQTESRIKNNLSAQRCRIKKQMKKDLVEKMCEREKEENAVLIQEGHELLYTATFLERLLKSADSLNK